MKYDIDDVIDVVIKMVDESAMNIYLAANSIGISDNAKSRIKENAEEIGMCIGWLAEEEAKRLKRKNNKSRKKSKVEK